MSGYIENKSHGFYCVHMSDLFYIFYTLLFYYYVHRITGVDNLYTVHVVCHVNRSNCHYIQNIYICKYYAYIVQNLRSLHTFLSVYYGYRFDYHRNLRNTVFVYHDHIFLTFPISDN